MIKYIDDLREVYKLLKQGLAVYCKTTDYRFEMCGEGDEIYVFDENNQIILIGCYLTRTERYYIDVQEPVKLESGKFYKTRDGRKVICYYIQHFNCNRDNFWMMELHKCVNPKRYAVYSGGNQFDTKESTDDIVDYWKD